MDFLNFDYAPETFLILNLVAAGVVFLAFLMTFTMTDRPWHRYLLFFWVEQLCVFIWFLFVGIAQAVLNIPLFLVSLYASVPAGFGALLVFDAISRDRTEPIKLALFTGLSLVNIIMWAQPDAIHFAQDPNGDILLYYAGSYAILATLQVAFVGIVWVIVSILINVHAPKALKSTTRLNLVGGIIVGIVAPALSLSGLNLKIPSGFNNLIIATGCFIMAMAIRRNEKIGFILPF
ncbi:MAG TPA: hypothetical protein VKK79_20075, partial [Candidatus Lokiarchaeia archaeon]|nr:hypothetical protein [Candidatus Lokiarchaeia archaeon]